MSLFSVLDNEAIVVHGSVPQRAVWGKGLETRVGQSKLTTRSRPIRGSSTRAGSAACAYAGSTSGCTKSAFGAKWRGEEALLGGGQKLQMRSRAKEATPWACEAVKIRHLTLERSLQVHQSLHSPISRWVFGLTELAGSLCIFRLVGWLSPPPQPLLTSPQISAK